eukprot:143016-Amphidinium_carterae.1
MPSVGAETGLVERGLVSNARGPSSLAGCNQPPLSIPSARPSGGFEGSVPLTALALLCFSLIPDTQLWRSCINPPRPALQRHHRNLLARCQPPRRTRSILPLGASAERPLATISRSGSSLSCNYYTTGRLLRPSKARSSRLSASDKTCGTLLAEFSRKRRQLIAWQGVTAEFSEK